MTARSIATTSGLLTLRRRRVEERNDRGGQRWSAEDRVMRQTRQNRELRILRLPRPIPSPIALPAAEQPEDFHGMRDRHVIGWAEFFKKPDIVRNLEDYTAKT